MATTSTALVLGATGGIGGEMARQLRDTGWQVRALQRGLAAASESGDGIHWLRGDAMRREDVLQVHAARGCAAIVHAVNPPGYRRWSELVLQMIDNTIAAACAEGATIVLPGTVYNYGLDAYPAPDEDAAQTPATRKGARSGSSWSGACRPRPRTMRGSSWCAPAASSARALAIAGSRRDW